MGSQTVRLTEQLNTHAWSPWLGKVKVQVALSRLMLCDPQGLYSPWNFPGQNIGVGSLSLLQDIFPTQGSNSGLHHCRWILYQLSHQGSPRKLEWVAYPFSGGSSSPRNQKGVSCIAGRFFTSWAIREAHDRARCCLYPQNIFIHLRKSSFCYSSKMWYIIYRFLK